MNDGSPQPQEEFQDPFYKNKIFGSRLLNRMQPPGYGIEWLETLKTKPAEDFPSGHSVVIFRIANEWLALPSHSILEITHSSHIHKLPHTNSPILLGISNVHGELLITISMQTFLDLPAPTKPIEENAQQSARSIVLEKNKEAILFPVHEIHGITFIPPTSIAPPPLSTSKAGKNFFIGIFSLNNTLIGLLDDSAIMDAINLTL